jgi:probable rRNA maturation factor
MKISISFDKGLKGDMPTSAWLRGVIKKALVSEDASPSSEVSVLITGQERVHELNRTYLDEDRPTDVLSFPMLPPEADETGFIPPPDGQVHLGEVIISLPQAEQQARERGHSARHEIALLTIHGVLHLLGHDHANPDQEREMRRRETGILSEVDPE